MDTLPHVNSLAERKAKLIAVCDLQRDMIALEWQTLRSRAISWPRLAAMLPKASWLVLPLVGFIAARKVKKRGGWLPRGWLIWAVARRGWKVWKMIKRH